MYNLWCELTKHDCLIIVKFVASTIYQFHFMKILLVLFLSIQIPNQLIQIYLFTNESSVEQFIQYSPAFFTMLYPILAAIILLTDPKLVDNLFDEIDVWPIENAVESTRRKIQNEMKIVSLFTIINTIATIYAGLACFFFNSYDYTTFLPIKYFVDYHPEYSNILIKIYKASLTFAALTAFTAHAYQIIYYTQQMKYQLWMLIDSIDGILEPENYDTLDQRQLIDDCEYQRRVKSRLIDFIKRHQEWIISAHKKINKVSNYVAYFSICGLLLMTSVIYVITTNSFAFYDYRYLGVMGLFTVITASAIILAGQSAETTTENLYYSLKQTDWYLMNNENRKIYFMLLMNTQRKVAIKFSDNYSVNYTLGLAVVRGVYSLLSVLA